MSTQLKLGAQADAEHALTAEGFAELHAEHLREMISVWPARSWYPSSIAHPCDRYLVWSATRHHDKLPHDVTLQSIFEQGKDHEPIIRRRLEAMGFEIMRDDRPRQYPARGGATISGKPDGRIVAYRGTKLKPPVIVEIKSMSGYQFDGTRAVADLREADSHWTRSYYAQGQLYCFLEDTPMGVFVVESKATGMLRLLPYELDYDYVELLLQRVERLQPLIRAKEDPPPIPYDRAVCGGCGFRDVCYPAKAFGEGVSVLDDPNLEAALLRRERLKPSSEDYAKVDREVKERLKHEGVKFAIAGEFVIEGKPMAKAAYTVPAHDEIHYTIRRRTDAEIPF